MISDIYGFTTGVATAEEEALARVQQDLKVLENFITKHGGKVITHRGDGYKAMFDSPVGAMKAAIEMQQYSLAANSRLPAKALRIRHRIGVHVGDVVLSEGNVSGMAVAICARLEQMCTPGQVCLSADVYRMVRQEIKVHFSRIGPTEMKNVPNPVDVWQARVLGDLDHTATALPNKEDSTRAVIVTANRQPVKWTQVLAGLVMVVALLGIGPWIIRGYRDLDSADKPPVTKPEKTASVKPAVKRQNKVNIPKPEFERPKPPKKKIRNPAPSSLPVIEDPGTLPTPNDDFNQDDNAANKPAPPPEDSDAVQQDSGSSTSVDSEQGSSSQGSA